MKAENKKAVFFLGGLLLVFIICVVYYRINIVNNHKITMGKIIACYGSYGKGGYSIDIDYKFSVNGIDKIGNSGICSNLNVDSAKKKLVGLLIPIAYNPDKLWINSPIINSREAKVFNISFPDSLKWFAQYISCK